MRVDDRWAAEFCDIRSAEDACGRPVQMHDGAARGEDPSARTSYPQRVGKAEEWTPGWAPAGPGRVDNADGLRNVAETARRRYEFDGDSVGNETPHVVGGRAFKATDTIRELDAPHAHC